MSFRDFLFPPLRTVDYAVWTDRVHVPVNFLIITDLHNGDFEPLLEEARQCDAILVAGDLINRHKDDIKNARRFLKAAPRMKPTYVSLGNHEWLSPRAAEFRTALDQSKVHLLDGRMERFGEVSIGGLSSGPRNRVHASVVPALAAEPGYRLLLCHHPEWYAPFVARHDIDLTVSGHAHGGQVRLFGQGLYAPGQGYFPALTRGFYEHGRLLVSPGVTNACGMPRIGNPCELFRLHLIPAVQPKETT